MRMRHISFSRCGSLPSYSTLFQHLTQARPALERTMMRTTRGSGAPVLSAEAMSARFSASISCSSMNRSLGISDRLELEPLDPVHVHSLDADELRRSAAPGRVQVPLVVQIGVARRELVGAQRPRLAGLVLGGGGDQRVVGHLGFPLGLPIDRPGRPVVVRRGFLGAGVVVREDAEAELGILVQHLALGGLLVHRGGNELRVAQQLLQPHADLAPPGGAGLRLEDGVAVEGELLERGGHGWLLLGKDSNDHGLVTIPQGAQCRGWVVTTTSSWGRAARAACSPTACPAIRRTGCCCSRPAARTTGSGSTSRWATSTP